uniref:Uncharacterized protein n=1 Tax=Romanomermis culicivorax TaxID=13658 RepID=A0A915L249_ROMCU
MIDPVPGTFVKRPVEINSLTFNSFLSFSHRVQQRIVQFPSSADGNWTTRSRKIKIYSTAVLEKSSGTSLVVEIHSDGIFRDLLRNCKFTFDLQCQFYLLEARTYKDTTIRNQARFQKNNEKWCETLQGKNKFIDSKCAHRTPGRSSCSQQ